MSHFTEVKTQITNEKILKKSLEHLGHHLVCEEQGVQVRGYMGDVQAADFKITTSTHYDIGFKRNATGSYEVVGDWELMPRVAGITQGDFVRKLTREYAKTTILDQAASLGYEVTCHENGEEIEMVVTQW